MSSPSSTPQRGRDRRRRILHGRDHHTPIDVIDRRLRSAVLSGTGPPPRSGSSDLWDRPPQAGRCFQTDDFAAHPAFELYRSFRDVRGSEWTPGIGSRPISAAPTEAKSCTGSNCAKGILMAVPIGSTKGLAAGHEHARGQRVDVKRRRPGAAHVRRRANSTARPVQSSTSRGLGVCVIADGALWRKKVRSCRFWRGAHGAKPSTV